MTASIRRAKSSDCAGVRDVYLSAFPETESTPVAKLAVDLLDAGSDLETISLVAERDEGVLGHVAFSPVATDLDETWSGYILAPLGVKPRQQGAGVGTKLVETGLAELAKHGVNSVFVYGDPRYYARFGFSADTARHFQPPYELELPFGWQAIVLRERHLGATTVALTCVPPLRDPALW